MKRIAKWILAVIAVVFLVMAWRSMLRSTDDRPVLTLRVDVTRRVLIEPGTPLLFGVSMTGRADREVAVGSPWMPWQRMISLRLDDGRPLPWAVEAGRTASIGRAARTGTASSVARLRGRAQVYVALFEAAPHETGSLAEGVYRVRATLKTPWWLVWTGQGSAQSNVVEVEVRAHDPALLSRRLATAAGYYIRHQQYDRAQPMVADLVRTEPDRARSYVMLGDFHMGRNDSAKAIAAYKRAYALATGLEEPDAVTRRLAAAMTDAR
jgi:hypothetical protein